MFTTPHSKWRFYKQWPKWKHEKLRTYSEHTGNSAVKMGCGRSSSSSSDRLHMWNSQLSSATGCILWKDLWNATVKTGTNSKHTSLETRILGTWGIPHCCYRIVSQWVMLVAEESENLDTC